MAVQRWTLHDPVLSVTYTFPKNPSKMGNIHPKRNFTPGTTTAIDGQNLITEGNRQPHPWQFSGTTLDYQHYSDLDEWSEKGYRIKLTEHFGRSFYVAFEHFSAVPETKQGKYWFHRYTMDCYILTTPTAATVGV